MRGCVFNPVGFYWNAQRTVPCVPRKLIGDRAALLADLREVQETYSGTDKLSQRLHELDDRLNAEEEAVQQLIVQNARVA